MMITLLVIGGTGAVYADKLDFSKCAVNPDHHCYSFSPKLNQIPTTGSPNWSFDIFMATNACNIKGTMDNQGNCSVPSVIVSDDNYTNIKNNVGVESLENIHTVSSSPNTNYCPLGLFTLNNQDGYLYKVYNNQTGLDLTAFMYPSYCYPETGKNPINGQGGSVQLSLTISTDKTVYSSGNIITVTGTTISQSSDITIMIISPTKNIITIFQVTPTSGTFTKTIQTGGILWQQTGIYTVKATEGTLSSSTNFTISSVVPEFPQVGIIVLAIAVLSLIIFTTKSEIKKW